MADDDPTPTPTPTPAENKFDPVARSADISWKIRESVRAALPAPMEQFFTVMVPGKVINFEDFTQGFDAKGNHTTPILPLVTELNQARLCDDMPVLGPVQLGPTGRSVARSYDAAISKLVPTGATIGVDVAEGAAATQEELRYQKAMNWLSWVDPDPANKGQARVELYREKQRQYTEAVEKKTKAFNDALQAAKDDPRNSSIDKQREAYDIWVNQYARTYRNLMQAAYMDWVVVGKKEEVEYYFSIVDRDSAMSRVEASKEAMRASVVQDVDGATEYHRVTLDPSNWAVLARNKALSGKNLTRTVDWYTWEITRLLQTNAMLKALQDKSILTITPVGEEKEDTALTTAVTTLIAKREAWQTASTATDEAATKKAYDEYITAREEARKEISKNNNGNIAELNKRSKVAQEEMYNSLQGASGVAATTIADNNKTIATYTTERAALLAAEGKSGGNIVQELSSDAGIPQAAPDPQAIQTASLEPDYFTSITVEIASSSSKEDASFHATAASLGISAGWGLYSGGVNVSYSNTDATTSSYMAKNACKISFECMRVDITRPWMRPELFYDADLGTAKGDVISPGFIKLRKLMETKSNDADAVATETELQRYSTFPLYPTAFLLAANVVLELMGDTTEIQTAFHAQSLETGGKFGYGPFVSVNASYSDAKQSSSATCEATADGCRITIKSPQVIGWISEMVPALPRLT